jgi:hypothetical protein
MIIKRQYLLELLHEAAGGELDIDPVIFDNLSEDSIIDMLSGIQPQLPSNSVYYVTIAFLLHAIGKCDCCDGQTDDEAEYDDHEGCQLCQSKPSQPVYLAKLNMTDAVKKNA